jgi:hypothetical protein
MNVHVEMLNQLAAYFRNEISVEVLRDYMVGQYLESASLAEDDNKFLSEFEGRYAELSNNLIPESVFKQLLAANIISSLRVIAIPQIKVLGASASTNSYGVKYQSSGTCYPAMPVLSHA